MTNAAIDNLHTGRTYHTLCGRYGGKWIIEFGDYHMETVRQERSDQRENNRNLGDHVSYVIIDTGDRQCDINAAVDRLNGSAH